MRLGSGGEGVGGGRGRVLGVKSSGRESGEKWSVDVRIIEK